MVCSRMIRDVDAIARRMAESMRSHLRGFVFSRDLVDPAVVRRLISVAGVENYLTKAQYGDIIVYAIRSRLVEARCQQIVCRNVDAARVRSCVAKCINEQMREVAETIAKSILEAARVVEE